MSELVLLPTLDRLRPYDGNGMAFGLTLQAALGTGVGFDRQRHASFLQPWEWKQPREVRVMLVDDEGRLLEEEPETADLKGFDEAQELIEKRRGTYEAWHKSLRDSFESSAKGNTRWNWSGAGGFVELQEGSTYWPAFLGELSLLPWPLPQSLGLSFFFKTRDLGAARLVVAPVLPAGFLGEGQPGLWPIPCGQDTPEIVRIEYFRFVDAEAGAGTASDGERLVTALHSDPEIVAQAKSIPLVPQQGCFFDFGTLWVKKPGAQGHVFREDWRSAMEDRLAEGLHLLPVFVQVLSQATLKAKDIRDALPSIARQGLAMLADIHGPGVRGGAPGDSLLSHAAQELTEKKPKEPISDGDAEKLASAMETYFYGRRATSFGGEILGEESLKRLSAWAGRVDRVLGDKNRAKDLLDRPGTFPVEEVFSRLLSLEADLAAGDHVVDLHVQHWQDFWKSEPADLPRGARLLLDHLRTYKPPAAVLRRKLLWDHLGLIWKDEMLKCLGEQDGPAALRPILLGFILAPGRLGMSSGRLAFLKEGAENHVDLLLKRLFPDPQSLKDAQPRRTRGLTVQVDTIACDPKDGSDFLERIQGVGLLMRRSGPPGKLTPWLPLNVGRACLPGGSREAPAVLADRVLVPTRLAYLNGLRDAMITYDNEPLGVESPIASALADALAKNEKSKDPAVRFLESDARVPALAYGATYQILPFLVANNGAVPSALASVGLPWGGTKEVADSDLGDAKKEIRTVVYKRLTPVGPLRVGLVEDAPPGRRPSFELPAVPEGVALRARDLPPANWLPGDPELARITSGDSLSNQLPCLFLAPKALADAAPVRVASSFRFGVRPPAVDLQTWDRFLALDFNPDGKADARRQRVWESVHGLNLKNLERKPEDALDASLDDPAVTGLEAELWEMIPGNPLLQLVASTPVPWPALPDREDAPVDCESLLREQRGLAPVEIGVAPRAGLTALQTGLHVHVCEGGLYRLTLKARLDPRTREERFEKEIEKADSTSPWHLAIEVAEPFLEEKERPVLERWLWERLVPDRKAASSGRLRVTLEKWKDADSRFAQQAFQAELRHQAWGWRGRPLASPHPDLEAGTGIGTLDARAEQGPYRYLAWELANLGDRRDFECRRAAMLRRTAEDHPGIPSDFVFDEPLETGGILEPQAGHHRFGVHVISRYAPILPAGEGSVEARDSGTSDSPWRSLFVPCRFRGEVPAPKVRLILPLTDHQPLEKGDDERGGAPGWLVVLDEEWFAVGGLAESLEVEVLGALSPSVAWTDGKPPEPGSCPAGQDKEDYCYHQLGPDPIVTGKDVLDLIKPAPTAKNYRALDAALYAVEFDAVHGPAGHHRDFTDTTPHILASSFVIRPPRISDRNTGQTRQAEDVGYWLYQIRLRRSLRIEGRAEPLLSEPTAPFWVQLLPAISRVEEEWIGTGPLRGSLAADGGIEIQAQGTFKETDRRGFEVYAVLTRQVFDVTGNRDQEAYLTVAGPLVKRGQSLFACNAQAARGGGSLKARLLEVQRHPDALPPSDAAELWRRLFGIETPDRERGRIVRISRPFEVEAK